MRTVVYGIIFASSTMLLNGATAETRDSAKPMNILFLIIDDLNTWLLSREGRYQGQVVAPNIRKLAASGVSFTHAYCASPKCSPSRTSFLSGVAPWKSGHTNNGLNIKNNKLLAQATAFPKLLQKNGYLIGSAGKVGHGYDFDYQSDIPRGEGAGGRRPPFPPNAPLKGFGKVNEWDWGPIHIPEREMGDTKVADFAIDALQMDHEQPFFIAAGLFCPHMPWYVPQKYFDLNPLESVDLPAVKAGDSDDLPPPGKSLIQGIYQQTVAEGKYREGVQGYLAGTSYADAQMGRILDALERSRYRDNTIVILFSDHGFHVGEKGHWQKGTLWEDGSNTLLMIRVPGMTEAGTVCERPVSLLDLYPTIMELAGIEAPAYLDGHSLVPLLKDVHAPWEYPAFTVYDTHMAVRTRQYRLIRYGDGSMELYDHAKDGNEWNNLADDPEYADIRNRLAARLPAPEDMAPMAPAKVRGKGKH
ncbi:MAG: sulfatase [Verrucomicrobiota bacterium]